MQVTLWGYARKRFATFGNFRTDFDLYRLRGCALLLYKLKPCCFKDLLR